MLICDISILHKYGKQALDRQLKPLGLNWQELVVMVAVETIPSADQGLLSKLLQTDKGNVTKLLNRMEKDGVIARKWTAGDCRRKDIRLTEAGEARMPALHEAMGRWEAACYKGLSPEEVKSFTQACATVIANIYRRDKKTTDNSKEKTTT